MCTAISLNAGSHYFGRTLDHHCGFGEEIVLTPRGYLSNEYALLGMALVEQGLPLYFDAVNEKGLAMAGLHFGGYAHYAPPRAEGENVASWRLIPRILGTCANVSQALEALDGLQVTDEAVNPRLPPTPLHWLLADTSRAVAVEPLANELRVTEDPAGVLTNGPELDFHMAQLAAFQQLTPDPPQNRFPFPLPRHCHGMGAQGLPGDLSSPSRFVRAAYFRAHGVFGDSEAENAAQFFQLLGTVAQLPGCSRTEAGELETTRYCACINCNLGIYYYTTQQNPAITAVTMASHPLDGPKLLRFPLLRAPRILVQKH